MSVMSLSWIFNGDKWKFWGGWEMSSPTHDWIEGVWPLGKVNRLMFYTVKRWKASNLQSLQIKNYFYMVNKGLFSFLNYNVKKEAIIL